MRLRLDAQLQVLLSNAIGSVMWVVVAIDYVGAEGVLPRNVVYAFATVATLGNLLAAGLMVRFFTRIVSQFHPPTKRVLLALDILCALFTAALLASLGLGLSPSRSYANLAITIFNIAVIMFVACTLVGASLYAPAVLTNASALVRDSEQERLAKKKLLRIIRGVQLVGFVFWSAIMWQQIRPKSLLGEPLAEFLGLHSLSTTTKWLGMCGVLLFMGRTQRDHNDEGAGSNSSGPTGSPASRPQGLATNAHTTHTHTRVAAAAGATRIVVSPAPASPQSPASPARDGSLTLVRDQGLL